MSTVRTHAGDGRQVSIITRDDIADALREYARRYGDDFPQSAFSPSQAKRNGRPELVERYYAGRENGSRWPSLNAIKDKFDGSFNAARAYIGLPANTTGPARGRRKPGEAEPILNVRERLVYVSDAKTTQLRERLQQTQLRLANMRESRDLWRERAQTRPATPKTTTKTKTKTVTKTVKVKDGRAVARLEARLGTAQRRLAEAEARARAIEDQLRAEQRDRNRDFARLRAAEAAAREAQEQARSLRDELDHARDRLVAVESLAGRYQTQIEEHQARSLDAVEAATVHDLVRQAEARAERAEVRAARAERQMAEQGAAVTGEPRRLTPDELAELRAKGPAGPVVLAKALKQLAVARKRGGVEPLRAALTELAKAAITWRDRL